jgi:hypothetical protein
MQFRIGASVVGKAKSVRGRSGVVQSINRVGKKSKFRVRWDNGDEDDYFNNSLAAPEGSDDIPVVDDPIVHVPPPEPGSHIISPIVPDDLDVLREVDEEDVAIPR